MSEKTRINEIKWYLKQLIPLTYWTKYRENNKNYFCVWKMWFGKPFDVTRFRIK